jgi:hypothetical protein
VNTKDIISQIDNEIARLQQARSLLAGLSTNKRGSGAPASANPIQPKPKKRTLSPAARKRIADAQRKRWAAQKAIKVTKLPPKTAPKKREAKAPVKVRTALSGKVPAGPVAAPASAKA